MKVIREPYTKLFLLLHTSKGANLKNWVKYDEQKEYNKPLRDKKGQQEKTIPGKAERMKVAKYALWYKKGGGKYEQEILGVGFFGDDPPHLR